MSSENKSNNKNAIRLFEQKEVRAEWDEQNQKWWFSVVDIVGILTEQPSQRGATLYWGKLKERLKAEGFQLLTICQQLNENQTMTNCHGLKYELYTNCIQLKMLAKDGKMRLTDVADTEGIFRIIQSIPSKKAEPFKMWLAKVGSERIDETIDPELSIDRMVQNYRRLGYSENWINQRIKSIEVRKALTDEWDKSGVKGSEYAILTDLMSKTWAGLDTKEYKKHKDLKKENLRDNFTNIELILNMLAEASATDISQEKKPKGFSESLDIAAQGAEVARDARISLEQRTGKSAISNLNFKSLDNKEKLSLENND